MLIGLLKHLLPTSHSWLEETPNCYSDLCDYVVIVHPNFPHEYGVLLLSKLFSSYEVNISNTVCSPASDNTKLV